MSCDALLLHSEGICTYMSEVVQLPVKRRSGVRRNVSYECVYDREWRLWTWRVTVIPPPEEFTGTAATEKDAMRQVESYLQTCVR